MFEYEESSLEDALYAAIHIWEDSRLAHLRHEVDDEWQPIVQAIENFAGGVIKASHDLSVPAELEGVVSTGGSPHGLLDDPRLKGLRKLALEHLQVRVAFANSTDVEGQAERALELTEFLLQSQPPEAVVRYVRRLTRCYVLGLHPECVVMCRAILDTAFKAAYQLNGAHAPEGLAPKIATAEAEGWLNPNERVAADTVRVRGNKAVHDDPTATEDVLGTLRLTIQVLRALL